uniref:Secreted protein n=1 Tax=Amblyomma parvum TaxID=251391 RepID=A0A023G2N6_AMBPA
MAAFLCIFLLWAAATADAASSKADIAEARTSESGRTFGALLPLALGLMPLMAPVISKGVFMVLLSGVAYLVLFVGSFFFPALGGLIGLGPVGLRSFDEADPSENGIDRVARVVRQAIASTEESVTGGTTYCRRRLICELSKSVSDGVPKVEMFDNYFRNLTGDADSYAGAWASGWLHRDCARFYKECDRTSVDSLSTIVGLLGGPDGYIGTLLSGFTNSTVTDSTEGTTASWITTSLHNLRSSRPPPFSSATVPHLSRPLFNILSPLPQHKTSRR